MDSELEYQRATEQTVKDLRKVAKTLSVQQLSKLSLPEVDAVVDLVAKIIPAGNVPGMILSGLARISGGNILPNKVRQDINVLFKVIDQAKYSALFATPAAIIWGYQNLLRLAGKDPESSFPEGTWQFYVDYALREDSARHASETHGFDTLLKQNKIHLSSVDRLTSWVMAAIMTLHQYDALLANEWRERTSMSLLQDFTYGLPGSARYSRLLREWEMQRPYGRDEDAAGCDYPTYRRRRFNEFLNKNLHTLPVPVYMKWETHLKTAAEEYLSAYQRQMSILAYLDPGVYGESRVPYFIERAHIGVIHNGNYFLLPACEANTSKPLDVLQVRERIAGLLEMKPASPANLSSLAKVQRTSLPVLRASLSPALRADLERLRFAPILINADQRARSQPLSELRQAERGVGDHALTIFDTGETFVFDQSHIFFDGAWGAALAEIMTNEALSWAAYLNMLPTAAPASKTTVTRLVFHFEASDRKLIDQAPRVSIEAGAETSAANLKACMGLRKLFKQRNDLLQLTINDLLVLYRAIHAVSYQPSLSVVTEVNTLKKTHPEIFEMVQQVWSDSRRVNPSILIPVDASKRVPRDRLYPLNLEVPLAELDLLNLHTETVKALGAYQSSSRGRSELYTRFDILQRLYLATIAGFGTISSKAKQIAIQGESASVGAIRLLAHLPLPLQRLLDKVPERFEVLNNLIKGSEVFSNLGAVSKSSSLTRFITAKDDNDQKQLAWGVMTDAAGKMHISLRDFRPHVPALQKIGRKDIAVLLAQDYLDSYAKGLNKYVQDISHITLASRETQQTDRTKKRL